MTVTEKAPINEAEVEEFAEKIFGAVLGAQEVQAAYIGDKLGWYDALVGGPLTSTELAEATDTAERYAREWLEHQTVSSYLRCLNPEAGELERRFELPAAHAEVLTQPESLAHMLPFPRFIAGLGKHIDALVEAYRTNGGVSWSELGEDPREAQAAANRPMFVNQLGAEYLASIPEVDASLKAGGRVADIGAGYAWSSIGVAKAYPDAKIDAFDLDEPSIEMARRNIIEAGLDARVTAHCVDAGTVDIDEPYDLVMALECIHDLPDPVSVLSTMRSLAGDTGTVIVMDENVGEVFTGEPDDVERIMYGFSLMSCLADGKAHDHSAETGTVMRPSTLEGYAKDAGFSGIEILPIENDFFRFYKLV
ncbi:MAG: class I SAM-dependent methyltransferase [Acidimicrobiales bacterium]